MKIILKISSVLLLSLANIAVVQARPGDVGGGFIPKIEAGKAVVKHADIAGFVIAARGKVTATDAAGNERVLKRRAKFYSNEVIKTGERSIAQLRFKDRALMRLKPNSELKISEYHFGGKDDPNNRSFMKLVSGGFRTISGSIGRANKKAYRVNTPAASIGIRGTDYEIQISVDGIVYAAVWGGGISIENEDGSIDLGADAEFLYAQIGAGLAPEGLGALPQLFVIENGEKKALSPEQKEKIQKLVDHNKGLIKRGIALLANLAPGARNTDGVRDKNQPDEITNPSPLSQNQLTASNIGPKVLLTGRDGGLADGKTFLDKDLKVKGKEPFVEYGSDGRVSDVTALNITQEDQFDEDIRWGRWETINTDGLFEEEGLWMAVNDFDRSSIADHQGSVEVALVGFDSNLPNNLIDNSMATGSATLDFDDQTINGEIAFTVKSDLAGVNLIAEVNIAFEGGMFDTSMNIVEGIDKTFVTLMSGDFEQTEELHDFTEVNAVVSNSEALAGQFSVDVPIDGSTKVEGSFIMK